MKEVKKVKRDNKKQKPEVPMWKVMGCHNALEWEGKKWFDKAEEDYNRLDTLAHEGLDEYL